MKSKSKNSVSWMTIGLSVLVISVLTWYYWPPKKVESMQLDSGTLIKFRTQAENVEVYENQQWKPFFVKGVNLGAALPGHDPGELPIDKKTYLKWFSQIQDMGVNTIRVYTILKPEFYEALVEYNRKHESKPLYFIQGIWSPEEAFNKEKDALSANVRKDFKDEIGNAVQAVYGTGTIPAQFGKASGKYTVNAGPYLAGWIVGTEWDPLLVKNTNDKHKGMQPYKGEYVQSKPEAQPFEIMLAEMLDTLAGLETKQGWQHPWAFADWVTTDPLSHPGEPLIQEDLVSVDPTHLTAKEGSAGLYASYHIYPYYPDFFRKDATLQNVMNQKGEADSYLAYLRQLKQYHKGMPIMVTEYGVPSSLGMAHKSTLNRNQGGHDEKEQGAIDAELYSQIVNEHYAGAILFTWQDEWFKKTWNTMFFEQPADRRKYWLNVLTNEKMFGVLALDPSKADSIHIDGDLNDWNSLKKKDKTKLDVNAPGIKSMQVAHDEAYVYLAVELSDNFDPAKQRIQLGVDTTKGGNKHSQALGNHTLDEGLETMITVGKDQETQVTIASNYDPHLRLYGQKYGMIPVQDQELKDDSGLFRPWKLAVDLEQKQPDSKMYGPFEDVPVGQLHRGTAGPGDSLTMWQSKGNVIEMRIPWMLLGFTDPSSLTALSYKTGADGRPVSEQVEGIRFVPWIEDLATHEIKGLGEAGSTFAVSKLPMYKWAAWNEVHYTERLKNSYDILKQNWTAAENASVSQSN